MRPMIQDILSFRHNEDVSRSKIALLVEWHEMRYRVLCVPLLIFLAGEGRVLEAWQRASEITHFGVVLGAYHHELHCGITSDF